MGGANRAGLRCGQWRWWPGRSTTGTATLPRSGCPARASVAPCGALSTARPAGRPRPASVKAAAVAVVALLLAPTAGPADAAATTGCVLAYAHRGTYRASGRTENTIPAFREAARFGAGIETDARVTKDNRIVLMHDLTVQRTTNGTGAVADLTLAQIKEFRGVHGGRVPTLGEAFRALPRSQFLVEVKQGSTWPGRVLDQLDRAATRHGHVLFYGSPRATLPRAEAHTALPVLWKHNAPATAGGVASAGDGLVSRALSRARIVGLHHRGLLAVAKHNHKGVRVWWARVNSRRAAGTPNGIVTSYADVYHRWCTPR